MMKKYCFNMIEIILAISIIAIGLSSVMALYVSGIRVGNDTVASSNIPDVSETLLNHIKAKIDDCRGENCWDPAKLNKIAPDSDSTEPVNFSAYLGESSDGDVIKGDDKGRFLYRQLSVSETSSGVPSKFTPVFTAVAKVERITRGGIILSDPADPKKKFSSDAELKDAQGSKGDTLMDKFRLAVKVTISYPADSSQVRDEKVFVMEVFNDRYDLFTEEGIEEGGGGNATP